METIKERPILFSGDMVRAILDGRKTQTRRVVRTRPENHTRVGRRSRQAHIGSPEALSHCPYGQPGDRLWVRETWKYDDWTEDGYPWIRYRSDDAVRCVDRIPEAWDDRLSDIWAELSGEYERKGCACDERWRAPIHMPRWVSRITLKVTGVRVERVQDISEQDAKGEGYDRKMTADGSVGWGAELMTSVEQFRDLWDSINAKRKMPTYEMGAFAWDKNPWVWVIEFERMD